MKRHYEPTLQIDQRAHCMFHSMIAAYGCAILMLVAVSTGCRSGNAATLHEPQYVSSVNLTVAKDVAWGKVTRFLALRNIVPTSSDKENGIVTASGNTIKGQIVDCPTSAGAFIDCHYTLSISLEPLAEGATVVAVRLNGDVTQVRRHHVLWIPTSAVKTLVACTSNGKFEQELFAYLQ
jgi:hypothetical protein